MTNNQVSGELKDQVRDIVNYVFNEGEGNGLADSYGNAQDIQEKVVGDAVDELLTLLSQPRTVDREALVEVVSRYFYPERYGEKIITNLSDYLKGSEPEWLKVEQRPACLSVEDIWGIILDYGGIDSANPRSDAKKCAEDIYKEAQRKAGRGE